MKQVPDQKKLRRDYVTRKAEAYSHVYVYAAFIAIAGVIGGGTIISAVLSWNDPHASSKGGPVSDVLGLAGITILCSIAIWRC